MEKYLIKESPFEKSRTFYEHYVNLFEDKIELKELLNKTIKKISILEDKSEMYFFCSDGNKYVMYHDQECFESVYIEDIAGNLEDIIGSPLLMADKITNSKDPEEECDKSFTWTFYNFATVKGYVTIRWYGESNGYYSEEVAIEKVKEKY